MFSQGSANAGSILLLTAARMNWGVKYDTNIMAPSLEEVKTNAAVRGANFVNSFSFGAIIVSFLSLLPITVPTGNLLQLIPQTQGTLVELLWGTKLNSRTF